MRYIKTYEEIKTINYILSVNESQINEGLIDRLKKMATKGLLTATVMASLMSNPTFAKEYKSLPGSEKTSIENLVKTPTNEIGKDTLVTSFGKEVDITKSFKSGKYTLDPDGKDELEEKLLDLVDYMNKAGYDSYDFDISASESLVPNKASTGLKDLELAKKRAETVKKIVEEFLKQHSSPGVDICTDATKGGPKWDGKEDINQQKFVEHQYVKIKIIPLNSGNPDNFCGYSYNPTGAIAGSTKTFDKEWDVTNKYGSGDIILKPGAIPDRIQLYADGQLIGDTGFFADKEHSVTKKLGFDYVPKTVYELTKLYNAKDASVQDTQFSKLKNFVIYCDPPYKDDKSSYYFDEENNRLSFDHIVFWKWCLKMSKNNIIFVSEYKCPIKDRRIKKIFQKKVNLTGASPTNRKRVEKLYVISDL